MPVAVAGSVATDHLMTFPGKFADSLVLDQLHRMSVSFLVEDLEIRRGGVAANICYGLGSLGLRPVLVAAVGRDFDEYRAWLDKAGVDTSALLVSEKHTARFVCTTDTEQCQIASFYSGAMRDARNIDLHDVRDRVGSLDLLLIGADDPEAMARHTREARELGIPFAADPSQQLAWLEAPGILDLIPGAAYLFTNDYEAALLESKTGWGDDEVLANVAVWVTTHGADGVVIRRRGAPALRVPVLPATHVADPTGVGDGFRAGFLAGREWGLGLERSAQLGCALATLVLEAVGPQDYTVEPAAFLRRFGETYGDAAAKEIAPLLS